MYIWLAGFTPSVSLPSYYLNILGSDTGNGGERIDSDTTSAGAATRSTVFEQCLIEQIQRMEFAFLSVTPRIIFINVSFDS